MLSVLPVIHSSTAAAWLLRCIYGDGVKQLTCEVALAKEGPEEKRSDPEKKSHSTAGNQEDGGSPNNPHSQVAGGASKGYSWQVATSWL